MSAAGFNQNRELIGGVIEVLLQGETLVQAISNEDYTSALPLAFNASIGGHYRHCLDHFRNLLDALPSGELNYDCRQRGTPVETDRLVALDATRQIRERFERLDAELLKRPLMVTCKSSYAASGSQSSPSVAGRELMYCVAHAVHHYALIGIMGAAIGFELPPGFGFAPSTVQHQHQAERAA